MRRTALLVQPVWDEATRLQYEFFRKLLNHIYAYAKARGINVIVLKDNVNEDTFKEAIQMYDPEFVYIGSHGTGNRVILSNDVLLMAGVNDNLLRGRIVYAFNCRTFYSLAKTSGARAFLGYISDFLFIPEEPFANIFMYLGFLPLRLIFDGKTVYTAYKVTRSAYKSIISQAYNNGWQNIIPLLEHNLNSFRFYGDPMARLI